MAGILEERFPPSSDGRIPEPAGGFGGRLIGGRYRVLQQLKRGEGRETLLALDLTRGDRVVVKVVPAESVLASAQMHLLHEVEVLRGVRSEWAAPLLDVSRQDGEFFLVMPHVPGVTLGMRLGQGPLSVAEAVTVGCCLMGALREAHGQGVLHRDLKPSNLIVDEGIPLCRATLIDFGQYWASPVDTVRREDLALTARYTSPEQAGVLGLDVDERSDLYSAGLVLYECLTGHPAFQGASVGEVLRQHLTLRPPEPQALWEGVPRVLEEVIQKLLCKDPRDRYQSAGAALADLDAVAEALGRGESEPEIVVGLHDRRRTLTEPAFVGRGGELAKLEDRLEKVQQGGSELVLLEAQSGGGKTRLLDELARSGARLGAWVLRGQGLDQAAQRPFQVLTGVARDLIATARHEPGIAEAIHEQLGDQSEAVGAALPELAEAFEVGASGLLGPERFGEARSLQALAALLQAIGSAGRTALILLDDCQWADELTLKLLGAWHRGQSQRHGSRLRLLLVVAFRSEEVSADHLLRTLPGATYIDLHPFAAEDVRRLAESMAGPLPEAPP